MRMSRVQAKDVLDLYRLNLDTLRRNIERGTDKHDKENAECVIKIIKALNTIADGEEYSKGKDPNDILRELALKDGKLVQIANHYCKDDKDLNDRLKNCAYCLRAQLQMPSEVEQDFQKDMQRIAKKHSPKEGAEVMGRTAEAAAKAEKRPLSREEIKEVEKAAKITFEKARENDEKGFKNCLKQFVELIKSFGENIYNSFVEMIHQISLKINPAQGNDNKNKHRDKLKDQQSQLNETGRGGK